MAFFEDDGRPVLPEDVEAVRQKMIDSADNLIDLLFLLKITTPTKFSKSYDWSTYENYIDKHLKKLLF